MKQSITAPNYAVNNVSNLPDIVKNQATTVKTTFDKASVDIKAYETNLIAELNGNNGSKKIGHNSLNIASDNVGDAIEEVYQAITSTVLGEIPDNSITNNKLAVDAKVGSIATLTTTEKSSVVGAINEINAYASGIPQDIIDLTTDLGVVETDLNIVRTAKLTTGSNVALAVDTDGTFDMTRNGNTLTIIPNVANTGAMTIAVDGQTARAIQKANDAGTLVALEAGDIKQNVPVQLVLQTSGTPVFIYAPKGGGIVFKNAYSNNVALSTQTLVSRVSVSGTGFVVMVRNYSVATNYYALKIDGSYIVGSATQGLLLSTTSSFPKMHIIKFNSSFELFTSANNYSVVYLLGNDINTATLNLSTSTAEATQTTSEIIVNGKGTLQNIYTGNNSAIVSVYIDGVLKITASLDVAIPLFTLVKFNTSFELRVSATGRVGCIYSLD